MSLIDSHLHVVSPDIGRYPQQPGGRGRDWWTGRTVDVDRIGRDLDAQSVDRGVIVQAVGPYRNDNRYARAAVRSRPERYALVVAIEANGEDPGSELTAEVAAGEVAAVRVFAAGGDAGWLTDGRGAAIWAAAAAAGTAIVAALFPDHLDGLAALVGAYPDVPVALDHLAFPDLTGGAPFVAAAPLFALAALPPVAVKLTTIGLDAARSAAGPGGPAALVDRLCEVFGPDRIAWGSDHPQTFETSYPEMVRGVRDACARLDATARDAILGGTAARLWFAGA